jgi:hypothetical protein
MSLEEPDERRIERDRHERSDGDAGGRSTRITTGDDDDARRYVTENATKLRRVERVRGRHA